MSSSPDEMSTVEEKGAVMHTEMLSLPGLSRDDALFLASFPEDKKKKMLRKIDWRLLPVLLLLYLITYIDKANIGNAKIEGLLKDLHMSGREYNVALAIFFIPYVIFEVPSNIILKLFKRPSQYLALLVFLWGVIMTCSGLVKTYGGLVAMRFLLGLFEAGFFPGAILLISEWYLPNEVQTRIAVLYSSAATGGAFSGLLAFGISKMGGIAGFKPWRWIFIIEGCATLVAAAICFFCLIDSPALSSRWLDADEIRYLQLRQAARRITNSEEYRTKYFDWRILWDVLTDWKIVLLFFANWSQAVPNYALKFAMPSIMTGMGYKSANAQLMTIPPYACGAIMSYILARIADKKTWRMPFIVAPQLLLIVAYGILSAKAGNIKHNVGLCYFAVCLACAGLYPIFPGVSAWNVANLWGPTKRGMGIAYLIAVGNIGGLIGSFIYIDKEAPKYPTGYGTSLGFAAAGIAACFVLEYALWTINKKNEKVSEDEIRAMYTDEKLERMGDKSPLYRYAL
ncbi:hypothetical protein BAUCODRAFT_76543 [Baudoinia panamericana UAMH 10762]|uniref:Major facilitator superfamily (MFS) profile domain-containing protein n=1 Tax=Baudoinia panamericana (strain UAMH 10762) TaxID=717646 RepID=M2LGN0_BAUPA|nr:uncharacterized protein BAUCODRAFT_76543 [Baudoinia panamericana UAMH 10762]EMC93252.1 hypothetical protein BAUCODRAFT_76543 [Baudoinia panamericana UAMH 10762]